ncbi:MAG: hypothetical protein JW896_10340 [Deltaproteobacteria bacterium]|nr:hypothetical protein [Deltaproteobacteria bacterium]
MKCPKCSYISFDYNQVCPKCSKDISAEQARLNLPSFRPDTPFLLEMLIGEVDESGAGLDTGEFSDIEGDTAEFGTGTDYFDSEAPDTEEIEFGDEDFGAAEDEGSLSTFDFEDLESDAGKAEATFDTSVTDFDLDGDLENIGETTGELTEEKIEETGIPFSEPDSQEDELDLDEESVSPDDFDLPDGVGEEEAWDDEDEGPTIGLEYPDSQGGAPEVAVLPDGLEGQEVTLDVDSSGLDSEETARATDLWTDDGDEVALDLDDLSVDESGELRVDKDDSIYETEDDLSLDLDDLDIDLDLDDSEEKS